MPLNVLLGKIGDAIVRRTDPTSAKYPVRTLLVAIVVFISAFLTAAQMHRLGWLPPLS
ncbi:hypothetical protein ACI7BZ_16135 [Xanthobacter sp. AM11]|uniref:hypothetical protein n=1 Tax=Xanthobacter sp. AM11 TaxID=3380643 RepID=UPI0039BF2D9F